AATELHMAQQEGAQYSPEGALLCKRAEQLLEESRDRVFRGQHEAARVAAESGYADARQARELAAAEQLRESRSRSAVLLAYERRWGAAIGSPPRGDSTR